MTGYRGADDDVVPVPFEYEPDARGDLPQYTTDGHSIAINTHFRTEIEAWASILVNVDAYVKLSGREVTRKLELLLNARIDAATAAAQYALAHDGYDEWKRKAKAKT